jgi:pyrroloquinoline quinone biosynthesis protein A
VKKPAGHPPCFPQIRFVYSDPGLSKPTRRAHSLLFSEVITMTKWEKPSYTDLRFGFEVTMYIYNR